jgi:thymidylate synthase-like protein
MKVYHFSQPIDPANGISAHPARHGTYVRLISDLLEAPVIHTGEWQAMDTSKSKAHATHELTDVSLVWDQLPASIDDVMPHIDQSWADDHFLERVSGMPYNPAPSAANWPYAVRGNGDHTTDQGTYDHTYPERFWPKHAGPRNHSEACLDPVVNKNYDFCGGTEGIRFHYGDLGDVVDQLIRSPNTRQAFLPVWFPEDTGANQNQRVPCTIGYHFMIRDGKLTTRYYIRSCDAYRHLSNDVWLAAMLGAWIVQRYNDALAIDPPGVIYTPLRVGGLVMHITSLHAFVGDKSKLTYRMDTA